MSLRGGLCDRFSERFFRRFTRHPRWWRGGAPRRAVAGLGALLCALALAPVAAGGAQEPAPASAGTVAREMTQGAHCGSVVILHCRRRREVSSLVLDPALRGRNGAPMQWEVVQFAGADPDPDEIIVNGERIRDPALKEVFDRAFGAPQDATGMLTRNGAGGARCTTIAGSGASLCSNSGGTLPALENPLTDWTF